MKSILKNNEKGTYATVDIAKFMFCIFVIGLHTEIFLSLPDLIELYLNKMLLYMAVPYFFVASGFFLRKKYATSDKEQYGKILKAYLKRLLYPFVFFSIVWLIQQYITQMLLGEKSTFEILIYLLQRLLFNPFGALWFVQALLVSAIVIYPMIKRKHGIDICILIGFLLFLFALLCNSYYFVVENTRFEVIVDYYMVYFLTARNGLFIGMLFVSLGMKCYDIAAKLQESGKKGRMIVFICLFLAIIIFAIEVTVLHIQGKTYIDYGEWYFGLLLTAPLLFLITILYDLKIPKKNAYLLRNLSTGMYYLHRPIQWCLTFFITNNVVMFFSVVFIALTICLISYSFNIQKKYYLLK